MQVQFKYVKFYEDWVFVPSTEHENCLDKSLIVKQDVQNIQKAIVDYKWRKVIN